MRDRDEYLRHGRNDPLAPEQLREHPYDFVSLPEKPAAGHAVGHHRYFDDRWSGTLTLVYETLSPLHAGSGVFESAVECGLEGGDVPVRGIARREGRPILPGSGWKGAVRARFEAITRSRLGLVDHDSREPASKVPGPLKGPQAPHRVRIVDGRVGRELRPVGNVSSPKDFSKLSPAEAIFGCMGYRGRIHPGDGVVEGPAATQPLQVAPLDGPVMHRLAKPGKARNVGGATIEISEVEGRKFYYDGDVVHARQIESSRGVREAHELVDHVPAGCAITIAVHLESFTLAELGALVVAAGHGEEVGIVRFGGYKAVGLGKVRLRDVNASLSQGRPTRRWRAAGESPDLAQAVAAAHNEGLIDPVALSELHAITTRRRP